MYTFEMWSRRRTKLKKNNNVRNVHNILSTKKVFDDDCQHI